MTIHVEYSEHDGQAWASLSGNLPAGTISGEAMYVRRQVAMQIAYCLREEREEEEES